jgi:heat-inducible transcriptional repressor
MASLELPDRSKRILATLIREYIETGEAVPSHVLVERSGLPVSSATVRNMLAQLEEAGYVHQPHTSAGRVPTDRGYRFFVDLLLETGGIGKPPAAVENELRQCAAQTPLMHELFATVTHLVSRVSGHVGFTLSATPQAVLKRIEFISLGGPRVLVVVISRGDQMAQKVVDAGETLRPDDLVEAANYLNTEFSGLPLPQVREAVLARLQQEKTLYDRLLARALRLASSTLEQMPQQSTFHVEGAASLLDASATHASGVTLATLRALLELIEEKERLIHLLNKYIDGPGLAVVIGAEHAAPDLRQFSLVASTTTEDGAVRTVGVIGPTRMRYSRAIGLVDGTSRAVARVLRDGN